MVEAETSRLTGAGRRFRATRTMKAIGEKCGWVIPRKEKRVLRLLRTHVRECDHEFVTNCPGVPCRKAPRRMPVEFAEEQLTAFEPHVRVLAKPTYSIAENVNGAGE